MLVPKFWREVTYPISLAGPVPKDVPIILQARTEGWLKIRDVETVGAIAIRDESLA
ncbi:MAG: hypothetical protein QW734_10575 [Candidatus Bathyarchaeia archaeon]